MPSETALLDYRAEFTRGEFERISAGLGPQEMEDKWFIFAEGLTVYLHRSWTGVCIFQVEFEEVGDGYRVKQVVANRKSDEWLKAGDDYDVQLLDFLIRNLLLDQSVPFPVPSNVPAIIFQHSVSGTAFPVKVLPGDS